MKTPLIRQGEGHQGLVRIHEAHVEEQRQVTKMLNLANSTPDEQGNRSQKLLGARSPAGDEQRLRGIPAITRGVSGAIPNTRPDLIDWDRRRWV